MIAYEVRQFDLFSFQCHEKYDEHIWQDLNFDWHFRCAGDALIRQSHLKKLVKRNPLFNKIGNAYLEMDSNSWIKLLSYKSTQCLLTKSKITPEVPAEVQVLWDTLVIFLMTLKSFQYHEKYDEHIWQDLNFNQHFRCAGDALLWQSHLKNWWNRNPSFNKYVMLI